MMPATIRGRDVDLRQLVEAHAPSIVVGLTSSLPELSQWFPWAQELPTIQGQIERALAATEAFAAGKDFEFSLFEPGADELVGGLRLNPIMSPGIAEIGYWVRSDCHRRGYATQAVNLATQAAFESLDTIRHVEIHMDPTNHPSQGVAAKAGYKLDQEIERAPQAPAHTGRALVWTLPRPA